MSGTLHGVLNGAVQQAQRDEPAPRVIKAVTLDPVELFPFVPYMRYMLPGVITLGMFMTVMIGGGMSYLDDKQRGVHEGYLVTPITKMELVLGQNVAGTIKAIVSGTMVTILGALVAGVFGIFQPVRLSGAVSADRGDVVRVHGDDVVPRRADEQSDAAARDVRHPEHAALFSRAARSIRSSRFPHGCGGSRLIDPFTYAVHGLRVLLLKGASLESCCRTSCSCAVRGDHVRGVGEVVQANVVGERRDGLGTPLPHEEATQSLRGTSRIPPGDRRMIAPAPCSGHRVASSMA